MEPSSACSYVATQRGGVALLFEGHRYNKVRDGKDGTVYWRCSRDRQCPGRAVTVNNRVKKSNNKHNHPPEASLLMSAHRNGAHNVVNSNNQNQNANSGTGGGGGSGGGGDRDRIGGNHHHHHSNSSNNTASAMAAAAAAAAAYASFFQQQQNTTAHSGKMNQLPVNTHQSITRPPPRASPSTASSSPSPLGLAATSLAGATGAGLGPGSLSAFSFLHSLAGAQGNHHHAAAAAHLLSNSLLAANQHHSMLDNGGRQAALNLSNHHHGSSTHDDPSNTRLPFNHLNNFGLFDNNHHHNHHHHRSPLDSPVVKVPATPNSPPPTPTSSHSSLFGGGGGGSGKSSQYSNHHHHSLLKNPFVSSSSSPNSNHNNHINSHSSNSNNNTLDLSPRSPFTSGAAGGGGGNNNGDNGGSQQLPSNLLAAAAVAAAAGHHHQFKSDNNNSSPPPSATPSTVSTLQTSASVASTVSQLQQAASAAALVASTGENNLPANLAAAFMLQDVFQEAQVAAVAAATFPSLLTETFKYLAAAAATNPQMAAALASTLAAHAQSSAVANAAGVGGQTLMKNGFDLSMATATAAAAAAAAGNNTNNDSSNAHPHHSHHHHNAHRHNRHNNTQHHTNSSSNNSTPSPCSDDAHSSVSPPVSSGSSGGGGNNGGTHIINGDDHLNSASTHHPHSQHHHHNHHQHHHHPYHHHHHHHHQHRGHRKSSSSLSGGSNDHHHDLSPSPSPTLRQLSDSPTTFRSSNSNDLEQQQQKSSFIRHQHNLNNNNNTLNNCQPLNMALNDRGNILKLLRALMRTGGVNIPPSSSSSPSARLAELATDPFHALIVPTDDAHGSEYPAPCDSRRAFLTNFTGSAGTAVVTLKEAALWTDGRYFLQAEQQLDPQSWTLMKSTLPETPTIGQWLNKTLTNGSRVAVDPYTMSYSEWLKLEKELSQNGHKLIHTEFNLVDQVWPNRPARPCESVVPLELNYTGSTWQEKVNDLRKEMVKQHAQMLVLTALDDIAWLFNLRGSDIEYNPVFFAYAIVTANNTYLFIDESKLTPASLSHLCVNKQNSGGGGEAMDTTPSDRSSTPTSVITSTAAAAAAAIDDNDEATTTSTEAVTTTANQTVEIRPYDMVVDFIRHYLHSNVDGKVWISRKSCYALVNQIPESRRILTAISPVTNKKAIKNAAEIAGMRRAHIKDAVALCEFFAWLEDELITNQRGGGASKVVTGVGSNPSSPSSATSSSSLSCGGGGSSIGMSNGTVDELTVAIKLDELRRQQEDYIGPSFETIAGSGSNGAIIHYSATEESNRTITTAEMFLLDTGAQFRDGTTDVTRTIHLGTPTAHQRECFTRVVKGHISLATIRFPRLLKGSFLDAFARRSLWEVGLDYNHGTGHGVGSYLNVHEGPSGIANRINIDDPGIVEDMIFSNEPGYYEPGQFGIRIESLMITKKIDLKFNFNNRGYLGFEPITLVPIQTKLLDPSLMTAEEIEWIDDYHQQCRDIIGHELEQQGRTRALQWLMRETKRLG